MMQEVWRNILAGARIGQLRILRQGISRYSALSSLVGSSSALVHCGYSVVDVFVVVVMVIGVGFGGDNCLLTNWFRFVFTECTANPAERCGDDVADGFKESGLFLFSYWAEGFA